jgi:membrane-bound ClpP family serine protease
MTWFSIIPLIILGLLLIVLEIFILPGIVSGVIGGLLIIFAIYKSYVIYGTLLGTITLVSSLVFFILLMYLFFRTKTWKRIALSDVIDSKVNEINPNLSVGDKGLTVSRLAPIGKAVFNNEYFEVRTNGNFLDENIDVVVFKIQDNHIYVKQVS